MTNHNSIPNQLPKPSLIELKMQYQELLLLLQERFWSKKLTCTPAIAGKNYEDSPLRLMYVGRAVNGWEADWQKNSLEKLVDQVFSYEFEMASISGNPNQNGYNFNKSPFWQLCKEVMKLSEEEENWSDKVLWSNLYKVAPFEGGNPDNKLIKEIIESCIKILNYEIKLYRPSHIVFVTDAWWFDPSDTFTGSFSKELNIPVEHNTDKNVVIIGRGIYRESDYNTKIVVTKRPEGLGITRKDHAEHIIKAFESLN